MINILYKKYLIFIFLVLVNINSYAQYGIHFQAIAKDIFNNPAKDRIIFVQTNIIQFSPSGTIVFTEVHQTNTDATGVFNIMVGNGVRVGGSVASFNAIDWSQYPYYLNIKIAIRPIAASNNWDYSKEWVDIGTSIFGAVPLALYSVNTAQLINKLNIVDTSKMLSIYAKEKTIQTLTSIVDTKLTIKDTAVMLYAYSKKNYTDSALFSKMNTFDTTRYTNKFYTDSALLTKMNIKDTILYSKLTYTDSALFTKMNTFDTTKYANKIYTDSALLTKLSFTGNAVTASIAGNITATSNTSLTTLTNLNTIGIITSGIWNATTIDIAHGGTGLSKPGLAGQVLSTSATGTLTWTNVLTSDVHFIGESYGGGIVFYVYDNGKHGLIAATSDQIISTRWYGGSYTNTRARADGVGAGFKNTSIIIAVQSGTYTPAYDGGTFAATVCNEYSVNVNDINYGDWYLPSKHELNLLFLQRYKVGNFPNISGSYWSSTEYFNPKVVDSYKLAWYQNFINGKQEYLDKKTTFSVRAIRAF